MNDARNRLLARDVGCIVMSVDYRLAPETPFPGAVEDAYAALRWLETHAQELGVDADRIVVAGESAGGGLAAALAILARDRGNSPLSAQILVYPMLDDRTGPGHDHPHTGQFVWTRDNNQMGWSAYLGGLPGEDDVPASAAPARCRDLSGLAPAFIACGTLDLFLEEDMEYARRLVRAGVPTELHLYPGAFHAFDLIADARVSKNFRRDLHNALERAFEARRGH
jgi:acetyl esterase/lipase